MKSFIWILVFLFFSFLPALVFSGNTLKEKEGAVLEATKSTNTPANQPSHSFSLTKVPKNDGGLPKAYAGENETPVSLPSTRATEPLVDKNPFKETGKQCNNKLCPQESKIQTTTEEIEEETATEIPTTNTVCPSCNGVPFLPTTTSELESIETQEPVTEKKTKENLPATGQVENAVMAATLTGTIVSGYVYWKSRSELKKSLIDS